MLKSTRQIRSSKDYHLTNIEKESELQIHIFHPLEGELVELMLLLPDTACPASLELYQSIITRNCEVQFIIFQTEYIAAAANEGPMFNDV